MGQIGAFLVTLQSQGQVMGGYFTTCMISACCALETLILREYDLERLLRMN